MGGMEMAVMEIVDVVAVGHGHVTAIRTVHMGVLGVGNAMID